MNPVWYWSVSLCLCLIVSRLIIDGRCASGEFKEIQTSRASKGAFQVTKGKRWREMHSLALHVPSALGLRCGGTQVLPTEGGQEHGGRQVHGRQVVGPGGQAGLWQRGLLLDDIQDVQGFVPRRVGEGDLLEYLWRECVLQRTDMAGKWPLKKKPTSWLYWAMMPCTASMLVASIMSVTACPFLIFTTPWKTMGLL